MIKLTLKGILNENPALAYGLTYKFDIMEVMEGECNLDTVYIVILDSDPLESIIKEHLTPKIVVIEFKKYKENEEYGMMPLNGFVDQNMTSWEIVSIN
ncbi:MAG: hypothetical protein QNK23_11425 [Crocinitomicaceae bacterium]|nr:hypothetical protein [Crocinitomicaceae bacterium]